MSFRHSIGRPKPCIATGLHYLASEEMPLFARVLRLDVSDIAALVGSAPGKKKENGVVHGRQVRARTGVILAFGIFHSWLDCPDRCIASRRMLAFRLCTIQDDRSATPRGSSPVTCSCSSVMLAFHAFARTSLTLELNIEIVCEKSFDPMLR